MTHAHTRRPRSTASGRDGYDPEFLGRAGGRAPPARPDQRGSAVRSRDQWLMLPDGASGAPRRPRRRAPHHRGLHRRRPTPRQLPSSSWVACTLAGAVSQRRFWCSTSSTGACSAADSARGCGVGVGRCPERLPDGAGCPVVDGPAACVWTSVQNRSASPNPMSSPGLSRSASILLIEGSTAMEVLWPDARWSRRRSRASHRPVRPTASNVLVLATT
jgi:hypothetical protein